MNLGRNITWNLAAFVWLSLLIVIVTPYMVRMMGLEVFGLWAIITASNAYLNAMDFGLGNALIRFLAAENERKDHRALENYLRSGVSLQLILGAAAATLLWFLAEPLARRWLQVPPGLIEEAVVSIRLSCLAVFLGFIGPGLAAVPAALHRFDLLALRSILLITVQYLFVLLVLALGGGLREVVLVYVAGTGGILVYLAMVSRRLLPSVAIHPGWHSGAVRDLLRFGRMKFPAQLAVTLLQQLDRIVVGVMLPIGQVAFYAVPVRVSLRVGQVAEAIASPIYPAVASHLVGDRQEELHAQYRAGFRMIAVAAGGAIAVFGGLAEPILRVWMGPDFAAASVWPLRVLLLAYAANALFTMPSVAADADARPGIPAAFLVTGSLVHAGLIWVAAWQWGIRGVAVAVLIGFAIPLVLGVPTIHRRVRALPSLAALARELRGVALAVVATLGLSFGIARFGDPGTGVGALLVGLLVSGAGYLVLLLLFRGIRIVEMRALLAGLGPGRGGDGR